MAAECVWRGNCLAAGSNCPLFSENWAGELQSRVALAPLTTLRVGGPAAVLARPAGGEQVAELLATLQRHGCPWRVLGRGSNLLVADEGYRGVVILLDRQLAAITRLAPPQVSVQQPPATGSAGDRAGLGYTKALGCLPDSRPPAPEGECVRVEAGCSLARLLGWSLRQGLGGLEFLVGIPGSLGGAVMMNAGAWGHSLGERVLALELAAAAGCRLLPRSQLDFAYRGLRGLADSSVVVAAHLDLPRRPAAEIRREMRELLARRRGRQPQGYSAGSFFKNPPGDFAGRLIEAAGLKGVRVGAAQVAPEHANFLVNLGGARAADLLVLMRLVQERVRAASGVELEPEVHFLGEMEPQ